MTNIFENDIKSSLIIDELDEKIVLHSYQVKGKLKTSVSGLENILFDDEEMLKMISKIKKQFGCGGILTENKIMEFTGDQRQKIKAFIKQRNLIDEDKIIIR